MADYLDTIMVDGMKLRIREERVVRALQKARREGTFYVKLYCHTCRETFRKKAEGLGSLGAMCPRCVVDGAVDVP